ncbi:MAG: molybdopterin-dependent oxidoreductase [Proteobacteria bacterium]|nr:molybdopterin-dependent oxidoreductase [Pseudomonadota bacterium]
MQKLPQFENHAEQTEKFTTCYMCACRCGVKVTLENNKIRFVQGNPNHPVNKGVLCGKGNAAIMKQYSPAKLKQPLMRKPGSARGAGEFVPISWEKAVTLLQERLQRIRQDNPNKLAFFTGRDQMQALTGLWATQFGTLNWAAHGGFCSVNMAAAGLMTHGYAFWEFGEPDWERTKYFMLWGVAEDHSSNPIKIGLKKLKERGVKIIAINPVRTGYQAIADDWVAITPGTDGMLAMSLAYVLLKARRIDEEFLIKYTNMPWLVGEDGLFIRDAEGNGQIWEQNSNSIASVKADDTHPALVGKYSDSNGKPIQTAMTLLLEECLQERYAPENAAAVCGIAASKIEQLAAEMAEVAFNQSITVDTPWTDCNGKQHQQFTGRPVSMHAMRGVSAHSNGFQSCRAIHLLQILLGAVDCPGGHLAKPPYPKHPPAVPKPANASAAGKPLAGPPLGLPRTPADLAVDENGNPLRIDKAFSWDTPLSAHGAMHMVIANAARHDPYPIDTLLIFMANMAWNSSMNTDGTLEHLTATDDDGNYKIPFIAVADAFYSEMVHYADLVLPDTTYLERYDTISLLDRPISEAHSVCDAIRAPVVEPEYDTRPWQEVLVELAGKLKLPAFTAEDGKPKFNDYKDFIINWEKAPGIGFLSGWRGKDGKSHLRGAPNPDQWQRYIDNECFFQQELEPQMRYYRFANSEYLRFAKQAGWTESDSAITIEVYSETLRKFQLAGEGVGEHLPPHEWQKERLRNYCKPLPFYYSPLEQTRVDENAYPFYGVTQRPMFMYHSWDSQNAWLRQIATRNYIYMNRQRGMELDIGDNDWVWLVSPTGRVAAEVQLMDGVAANTVWTWNAIGKRSGAWGLDKNANESVEGFLMNPLISEWLPPTTENGETVPVTNSDPITGQAAWYDLRLAIEKMTAAEATEIKKSRQAAITPPADYPPQESILRYASHKAVNLKRQLKDVLLRG